MSMKFFNLGSGSRGNASYLQCGDFGILVDCGFSRRELLRRLEIVGVDHRQIGAIFLTHEHSDHCRGVRLSAAELGVPVMLTAGTARALGAAAEMDCRLLRSGVALELGGFEILPLAVFHDAAEPCAYRIRAAGQTVAMLTDFGDPACLPFASLRRLDHLYVEANYDEDMLRRGPYPAFLQARIAGERGHLSNEQCGSLVAALAAASPGLRTVTLAHLSARNNDASLALEKVRRRAAGVSRAAWRVADQERPTVISA